MAATLLSQRKKCPGWLIVAGSVRQQEELAGEIEAWGGRCLVIPEAFRGSETVKADPDLEAEWLGSLASLVGQDRPSLVLVTEGVLGESFPARSWIQGALRKLGVGDRLDPLGLVE